VQVILYLDMGKAAGRPAAFFIWRIAVAPRARFPKAESIYQFVIVRFIRAIRYADMLCTTMPQTSRGMTR